MGHQMGLLKKKACKKCGKLELMGPSCDECLSCRVKEYKEGGLSVKQIYYLKNRERLLKRAHENYFKWKHQKEARRNPYYKNRRLFTVHFEKTEGGYSWRAWFRNPVTERLVKFESDGFFSTIKEAREDYLKATK